MTIRLFSGIPGSGKTLYVVSELKKIVEQNVDSKEPIKIYADITGLKITGIEPPPVDWRKTPPKSLLIYDEAQLRKEFAQARGRSKYDFVQEYTIHRKTGHQIWFITQEPKRLHNDILDMVEFHTHLERPYGAKLATIYEYRGHEKNPRSQSAKNRCENKRLFNYDSSLYDLYESSQVDDGIKFRLPKQLAFWGGLALIIPFYLIYAFFLKDDNFFKGGSGAKKEQSQVSDSTPAPARVPAPAPVGQVQQQVEPPTPSAVADYYKKMAEKRIEYYQRWLSEDYEVIKSEPALQVRGVIRDGKNCKAYNTFGDLMTLTKQECDYYIAQSGRVHKTTSQQALQPVFTPPPPLPQGQGEQIEQNQIQVPQAQILGAKEHTNDNTTANAAQVPATR